MFVILLFNTAEMWQLLILMSLKSLMGVGCLLSCIRTCLVTHTLQTRTQAANTLLAAEPRGFTNAYRYFADRNLGRG